jgi:hypothetical protein
MILERFKACGLLKIVRARERERERERDFTDICVMVLITYNKGLQ